MNDFVAHIAEVEGVKTPTVTRTKADLDKAFESFTEKRKGKRSAKTEKAEREAKAASKPAKKSAPKVVEPKTDITAISREAIDVNPGPTTTAGYDPASKMMHVEFSKGNVYAYPDTTAEDWNSFKATFNDPEIVSGGYFRKAFRGRKYVRVNETVTAKAVAVTSEVSK